MRISYSTKSIYYFCVFSFAIILLSATVRAEDEQSAQRTLEDLRDILKHRKTLGYIKNMLDTLYNDFNDMHKRACLVGGGMFHGCDYKDILEGTQDQNHYAFRSPGRKRRDLKLSSSLLKKIFQTRRK